ncbi:YhfH family protein [Brevibacillus humidisoli]|uniref:protein YhfH n=1 Tax=Brevibacillus humidisoli TaxID=2895522 RepID=UPI001E3D93E1|nr:protein YhfH [Brevibacillus humidisoli]UFJ41250.1 YhfH family protein [Brevibacillus humidisoli]
MMAVSEFFATLQKKCCSVCGNVIVEQAESYATECFHCSEQAPEDKLSRGR